VISLRKSANTGSFLHRNYTFSGKEKASLFRRLLK
jgi:hypothetical protein